MKYKILSDIENRIFIKMVLLGTLFSFVQPFLKIFVNGFHEKLAAYTAQTGENYLGEGEVLLYLAVLGGIFWGINEICRAEVIYIDWIDKEKRKYWYMYLILFLPIISIGIGLFLGWYIREVFL